MPTVIAPPGYADDDFNDRYIILSKLASGGMGETYRAWDKLEGRLVTIKLPKQSIIEKPGAAERFDREVRMMQRLRHPHIVPINDVGLWGGLPYFTMPFLPGGSLAHRRLRDDQGGLLPNPAGMLHLWLPAVTAALDHLHAQGVVHRDVKPANIFFNVFWHAFLGDFGVAKVIDDTAMNREETLTGTHMAVGTEFYMGPEMFASKPVLAGTADQYALAVTVYELLAGRRPFTGESMLLPIEIATQLPPSLQQLRPDLPAGLVQAVHRGLAKRPEERFASCGEFTRAVLAQVPAFQDDPGIARLACPKCFYIISISATDVGREGHCRRCRKRLVVAQDLSGLWTQHEQAIVAAHLAGQPAPAETEPPAEAAAEPGAFDFKPISKTVRVPPVRRTKSKDTQLAAIVVGVACLLAAGLAAYVAWPYLFPPDPWVLDRKRPSLADDSRLVVYPPKRFNRSPGSGDYLAEFLPTTGQPVPRIRVLAGNVPGKPYEPVKLGVRRATMWTSAGEWISGLKKTHARNCGFDVEGRPYTVQVTVDAARAKDADALCRLVAGGAKAGEGPRATLPSRPTEQTGLRAEYFKDRDLRDRIPYEHDLVDNDLAFEWGDGPPVAGLPPDHFSLRLSGSFIPETTGQHTFRVHRDNGLRIWVQGELVVDLWDNGWGEFTSQPVYLREGTRYPMKIEFYDDVGPASLTISVKSEIGDYEVVPASMLRPAARIPMPTR